MTVRLILGGARSGKSHRALELAEGLATTRVFVATAEPFDAEMADRIEQHRNDRGPEWSTREAPLDLVAEVEPALLPDSVVVVDCLTLWLSNLMHAGRDVQAETAALIQLFTMPGELILVSNEVGLGIVPETPLGRRFRDEQGWLNRTVAAACDRVELIVAGLPLVLK
ncbi:MAG: bifunctional adenosylcobinamide kinase/adenosylcobinamide-phosphate guanylyltransferase [Pseudomonadota bacterium]